MFIQFSIASLGGFERFVEGELLGRGDLFGGSRGVEGLELVVGDLHGMGAGLADEAIDSTTLEAYFCFPSLVGDSSDNSSLS